MEHHAGHQDEILAILAHELGHWKLKHVPKILVFNSFYMMIFGLLLIPILKNWEGFLGAFNFYHENYFVTMVLYAHLYINTVDVVLRLLIKWIERRNELQADAYSVRIGFGEA